MSSRESLLPKAGKNLFQRIKEQRAEAAARGVKIINLAIGQPQGPAIEEARRAAAEAIMSAQESMHEYQDNGSPGVPNFAQRFVQAHVKTDLSGLPAGSVDYLPIPGIKPMLGVVINSLGAWADPEEFPSIVMTMTHPGYPTPADQCAMAQKVYHVSLPMDPKRGFLFDPLVIGSDSEEVKPVWARDMIMLNFPHNPTGIVATEEWLRDLCAYCEERGIRIFNDAAYVILTHTDRAVTLTDIAIGFPNLNWAEAFSASKAGNMTGWRVGAMVGSPEFIGDIKRIKGNTDSGFAAPLAAGVLHLFEHHRDKIAEIRKLYSSRLDLLGRLLTDQGMQESVLPEAGFFDLFDCPRRAFGQDIENADQFNTLMINNTGVTGVPFDKWIRYAVCACDVRAAASEITKGFEEAKVSY